jgi:hypothetical protein
MKRRNSFTLCSTQIQKLLDFKLKRLSRPSLILRSRPLRKSNFMEHYLYAKSKSVVCMCLLSRSDGFIKFFLESARWTLVKSETEFKPKLHTPNGAHNSAKLYHTARPRNFQKRSLLWRLVSSTLLPSIFFPTKYGEECHLKL